MDVLVGGLWSFKCASPTPRIGLADRDAAAAFTPPAAPP
jgi:hypothetical protein